MVSERRKGTDGEDYAAEFLEKNGCRIICRNYKGKHGELDIIFEKDSYIVFAEVKMRRILSQKPAEAVDGEKMSHIFDTVNEFFSEYKDNNYIASLTPRIDVIEIVSKDGNIVSCRHIENSVLI